MCWRAPATTICPGLGEDPQGDLVGHHPGRDEERSCLADTLGVDGLQLVDRRVLAVAVVTDLGVGPWLDASRR